MAARESLRPAGQVTATSRRRSRIAAFIRELEAVGPDFAEISRRMGEPEEKVRYLFRSTLTKNGYIASSRSSRSSLGLRDAYALVEIAEQYQAAAWDVFIGMDDNWFLSGFYRTIPDGKFLFAFSIPQEHYDEFPELLRRIKESGFVSKVHVSLEASWRRFSYMDATTFDFRHARWEFDWAHPPPPKPPPPPPMFPKQRFDSTDLLIMLHLAINATTPLSEIAKKNDISLAEVRLHARHIAEAGLLRGCAVIWTRSHMNLDSGKPFAPRHRFAAVWTLIRSIGPEEQTRLSEKLWALPFTWVEAGGKSDYVVQVAFPLDQTIEVMSYLREVLRPVASRSVSVIADPAFSGGCAPPRFLVDDSKGDWVWDLDSQMRRLGKQLELARARARPPQ